MPWPRFYDRKNADLRSLSLPSSENPDLEHPIILRWLNLGHPPPHSLGCRQLAEELGQIDEILELVETQLTSSEVFTALFELEITGRVRGLPGKNYVRTM